jgi:hypothetical protein
MPVISNNLIFMKKFRKFLRIIHRDFGYFIVGMTIVYALSGIYFNHRRDLNPDYKIIVTEFETQKFSAGNISDDEVKAILKNFERNVVYQKHYVNSQGLVKVFIENGEVVIDGENGRGTMHYLQKRPLIFEMNKLHKASIGVAWKWVSDVMAVILILVAVSGLFILKGKHGFGRWGWWITIAGVAVPLLFVLIKI